MVQIIRVEVPAAAAELAADALWSTGPSAVVEEDLDGGRVRLVADGGPPRAGALPEAATVTVLEVDSGAHLDAWRAFARVVRAGQRVVLHPPWVPAPEPRPGDVVVRLDPGRAFGSGSHPSTRLALAELEREITPEATVLDVGCGSGVLAVAGVLLGAARAVATDVDPHALAATARVAADNGVTEHVEVTGEPLGQLDVVAEVVVANIGAATLVELAPALLERVAPDGVVVLSGLLEDQARDVVAAHAPLAEVRRSRAEGWAAVVLRC